MSYADEIKFSLKVMINKHNSKVLFAEADNDFIDVLLSFLTLSLGRIVKVLEEHIADKARDIGSLTTLYKGLSDLTYPDVIDKYILLNPKSSLGAGRVKLKLSVDQPRKDFTSEDTNSKKKTKRSRYASVSSANYVADDGDDGGFTVKSASFMISDDLQIVPVVPGSIIRTLTNLGITETDGAELRTLSLGDSEIKDLLKGSLLSKTPLSDLVFPERCKMDCVTKKVQQVNNDGSSSSSSKKMTIKALIQKSTNKILFVEAEHDFIDLLCSFLTIPLGAVEYLLGGNTSLNCIDNLYRCIAHIDGDKYMKTKHIKDMLLKPQLPECVASHDHFLPFIEKGLSTSKSASTYRRKFANEHKMYEVTDDLIVTPFCMTSSFSILSRFKVPLSDVNEVELEIGLDEALRILKASLTSTSALTDGLINSISKKQPKQEY